jgi:hypothetical protein
MKKNKFLFLGMLALALTFTLVLAGCPLDTDPTPAEKAATALAATLGGDTYATASGTTVTLKAAVTRTEALTVPAGVTLNTGTFTLTINDGVAFKVDGTVNVPTDGILTLGTTTAGISTDSYLNGLIDVNGGILRDLKTYGGSLWNAAGKAGSIVFENSGSADSGNPSQATIGTSGVAVQTTATTTVTLKDRANYTVDGDATLKNQFRVDQLLIKSGTVSLPNSAGSDTSPIVLYVLKSGFIKGEGTAKITFPATGSNNPSLAILNQTYDEYLTAEVNPSPDASKSGTTTTELPGITVTSGIYTNSTAAAVTYTWSVSGSKWE